MWKKLAFTILVAGLVHGVGQSNGAKTFATPEEARNALIQAAAKGLDDVKSLMGPDANEIMRTADPVEDKRILDRFNELVAQKSRMDPDPMNPKQMILVVGNEDWPFAVPLAEKNGRWFYDIQAGKEEIRRRIIGSNELDVIQICQAYVHAQEEYAATDWNGNGTREYAKKFFSSEGKKDGLYWPGEDSPVGENFARAVAAGYSAPNGVRRPFHGYYFKILLAQGPDADEGAIDYVVQGMMIGGFALVAWPAEYRVSGIQTFMVNQDGVVFEKDLGPQTGSIAEAMTKFNPDDSWDEAADADDDDQN
jgi:hypothetical protein